MAVVYTHTRKDTNVIFYVGIGRTEKRAYDKKDRNKHWKHIVDKVGYIVEIIYDCETWEEAQDVEIFLITHYGRRDLGQGELCNLTNGGDGGSGVVVSEETRAKRSAAARNMSDETRAKMSYYHKNSPLAKERLAKISAARIGTKHSDETRAKLSAAMKIRVFTDEHRAKISAGKKGQKHSEETRAKLREAALKQWENARKKM